jgi:octanoyl-[GcvH]:protein N-octanoyltransferase
VRSVLEPVYAALELEWDQRTVGAVEDELPAASGATLWDAVHDALLAEYAQRFELVPGELDQETLALARHLAAEHRPPAQAA